MRCTATFLLPFMIGFAASAHADVVRLTLKVEFQKNSKVIQPTYVRQVAEVAKFLEKYPAAAAVIEGHSDDIGSNELNLKISQGRADAVRTLLIEGFAIQPERIKAIGYGKVRPIADNATVEGRLRNRRVVASVEADQGTFVNEAAEIDVATPPPLPAVTPAPAPVKPVEPPPKKVEPEKVATLYGPRFLAGMIGGPGGPGMTYGWNPLVHQKGKFKSSVLLGVVQFNDKNKNGVTGFELGYFFSPEIAPYCDFDTGAMLINLSGGVQGTAFEFYFGFSYDPKLLSFWNRLAIGYNPILVRNANIHTIRISLGFDF